MNLWHQRIFILVMKFLGIMCGLVFLGYFLYYDLYFKTDSLIKYVPKDAVCYGTFRLNPELLQNQLAKELLTKLTAKYNLKQLNLGDLNQLVGNNLSLAIVPQKDNGSVFDILVLIDLGIKVQDVSRYQTWSQLNDWPSQVFSNSTKSKNIFVIASSQTLLDQVQQISVKQQPSLSQKIEAVFNLKKFNPESFFGKIYLTQEFPKALSSLLNSPETEFIVKAIKGKNQDIFAGFYSQENQMLIQTSSEVYSSDSIYQPWPDDFIYALSFSDLANGWQRATDDLKQNNPEAYSKLIKNKEYFEGQYNFSWENDLLPLLGNQVQVFSSQNERYLIATTLKEENVANQTGKIENLIKRYIANSYPVARSKQLPDSTLITTIVRDIDSLNFNEDEIIGLKIRGIKKDEKEYIYILANNHLILANSRDIIISLLNDDQKINDWKNSGNIYNFTNFSENAWINLEKFKINNQILKIFKQASVFSDKSSDEFMLILN